MVENIIDRVEKKQLELNALVELFKYLQMCKEYYMDYDSATDTHHEYEESSETPDYYRKNNIRSRFIQSIIDDIEKRYVDGKVR